MSEERRVWIAQCLCPGRHTILATAGEADSRAEAEDKVLEPLRESIAVVLLTKTLNDWCSLCNAKAETWSYEVGRTRFRTLEEATPELTQTEARNVATNVVFGDMKRSD